MKLLCNAAKNSIKIAQKVMFPYGNNRRIIGHSDDGHFHVHLHSCVIGNRRSSSHTQRAFQVLSPVYTCVTRVSPVFHEDKSTAKKKNVVLFFCCEIGGFISSQSRACR